MFFISLQYAKEKQYRYSAKNPAEIWCFRYFVYSLSLSLSLSDNTYPIKGFISPYGVSAVRRVFSCFIIGNAIK